MTTGPSATAARRSPAVCSSRRSRRAECWTARAARRTVSPSSSRPTTNPFFVEIQRGAQERAVADGLQLSVASGTQDGDVDNQIQAIDAAIERGDKAIMMTPSGPAVDGALKRARKAGSSSSRWTPGPTTRRRPTSPMRPTTSSGQADRSMGSREDAGPAGRHRDARPVRQPRGGVRLQPRSGIPGGHGHPARRPDEERGRSAHRRVPARHHRAACHEATFGAEDGGRDAMRRCLQQDPDVDLVYTINEPAALAPPTC